MVDMTVVKSLTTLRFAYASDTSMTDSEYERRRIQILDAAGLGTASTPPGKKGRPRSKDADAGRSAGRSGSKASVMHSEVSESNRGEEEEDDDQERANAENTLSWPQSALGL